jgi:hypothetical protein
MSLESVRDLVPLPDAEIVPPPDLFLHPSYLHGQAHVARVMIHALRLIEAIGAEEEAPRLWAAVYLHDIARRHDGSCRRHGGDAWARLATLPDVQALFARVGVGTDDHPAIEAAVTRHCNGEPSRGEPHYRLMALLKDADGLDRVRLGDLRPEWLRHDEARTMVGFAQRLFNETYRQLKPGPDYFGRLWSEARRILVAGNRFRRRSSVGPTNSEEIVGAHKLVDADLRGPQERPQRAFGHHGMVRN